MSDKRPHFSHSQLNLYGNCAEAYRRRYVDGQRIPPGIAALRGRGVHGGSEINLRQKIESGIDLPKSDIVDAAVTAFRETERRDGVSLTAEEKSEGAQTVIGKALDSTARLAALYADEVAPTIDPEMVEASVRIELPTGRDLLGVLDVATKDRRIVDLKTSAKSKRQAEADDSTQLTWYDMSYRALTGCEPSALELDVLVDLKTPKSQRLVTHRTARDYDVLVNRINAAIGGIEAGIFAPANVGHWMCSRKWCGYFDAGCPFVNSERRAASEGGDK